MDEAEKIKQLLDATHQIRDAMRLALTKEGDINY